MALLFLKKKLFPSTEQTQQRFLQTKSSSQSLHKPLLYRTNDSEDETSHFSDSGSESSTAVPDLEAQSYNTFRNNSSLSDDGTLDTAPCNSRSRINPRIISDAILGLSDGLTVPFALSAGLSALGNTKVVVLGGLAELAAGAISMGLGGYVGAKSEKESYDATVREVHAQMEHPVETAAMVRETFSTYGLSGDVIAEINSSLHSSPERLQDFLITFHHKESTPDCNQAWMSAITLALGYFVGGFIPLIPYFCTSIVQVAFSYSVAVMAVTLLVFGYVKTCVVRGWRGRENILAGLYGGGQMVVVGGVAAGAAIGLVRLIDNGSS